MESEENNFSSLNIFQMEMLTFIFIFPGLQFLVTMVSEGKEVIEDIKNSLSQQKELLALSAQQQEEVWCTFVFLFPFTDGISFESLVFYLI